MAKYDIIIKNGMVIDGKLGKMRKADVGIKGDAIKNIGDLSDEGAEKTIDASNHYVSPGFIDLTSHSDTHWTIFNNPAQESMLFQGVTTILGGNCSYSLAPILSGKDIEGIQKWIDIKSLNINWQTIKEFLNELSRHDLGLNFATLIGHGTLRREILKQTNREAKSDEIGQMALLLEQGLKDGAFGLSTSLGRAHARFAKPEEFTELLKIVKNYEGLSKHHLKDEGAEILPSISQIINLANAAEVKAQISHFKILGKKSWAHYEHAVQMIETAQEQGTKITLDIFPYKRTGSNLYMLLPAWTLEGPKEGILGFIRDPKTKIQIIEELKKLTLHYDKITIASTLNDPLSVGKTIDELSKDSGLAPEEVLLQVLDTNDINVSIFSEAISEELIFSIVQKKYVSIASDGVGMNIESKIPTNLPHPRSFGAFPQALNLFVKEKGALSFEEAVYKMTYLPATTLGLEKRGALEPEFFADLVIFNPEKIESKATYQNPFVYSSGVDHLIINGQIVIEEGQIVNKKAGAVLKKV